MCGCAASSSSSSRAPSSKATAPTTSSRSSRCSYSASWKGTGKTDLTAEFGDQLPPRLIAALLGMPWEDDALVARILHLHEGIMEVIGANFATKEIRARGLKISAELNDMLRPHIRDRRDNPKDDFISRVWTEGPAGFGEDLSEDDVMAICRELFLGGAYTTVHGIANTLYLVLTDAGVRTALQANPENAVPAVVEEAMRIYGSTQFRPRVANEDCVLGGVEVKKDQMLILMHSAANRDPAKYACPHMADLSRKPVADHLTFNRGPRSCIGAGLARAEMRDALTAVVAALPNLRLDKTAEPPQFKSFLMRSWRPLNVVFDAPGRQ